MPESSVFRKVLLASFAVAGIIGGGGLLLKGQSLSEIVAASPVAESICTFFGPNHAKYAVNEAVGHPGVAGTRPVSANAARLAALTTTVSHDLPMSTGGATAQGMPGIPGGTRTGGATAEGQLGMID